MNSSALKYWQLAAVKKITRRFVFLVFLGKFNLQIDVSLTVGDAMSHFLQFSRSSTRYISFTEHRIETLVGSKKTKKEAWIMRGRTIAEKHEQQVTKINNYLFQRLIHLAGRLHLWKSFDFWFLFKSWKLRKREKNKIYHTWEHFADIERLVPLMMCNFRDEISRSDDRSASSRSFGDAADVYVEQSRQFWK